MTLFKYFIPASGWRGNPRRTSTCAPSAGARGFTLLEILIAVALAGLIMIGLNTMIFSMGELWGRGSNVRLFETHVRTVTYFLESQLRSAVLPPAAKLGDTPISGREIKVQNANPTNLLTFLLPGGSRLITWPDGKALPEVVCSLQAREGEGLILLWHSRLETKFADESPRETVISPWVTALSYDYYDATLQSWTVEPELKKAQDGTTILSPQRIRVKFTYGKETREGIITLPVATEGLPGY